MSHSLHNKSRWHIDLWNVKIWRSYRSSECNCSTDVSKLMTNNLWTNISTSGLSWYNCKQYNMYLCEHCEHISSVYFSMQCFQVFFHCICVRWLIDRLHKDVEELWLFSKFFALEKVVLYHISYIDIYYLFYFIITKNCQSWQNPDHLKYCGYYWTKNTMEIFQDLSGRDCDGGGYTEESLLQAVPAAAASLWRETLSFHAEKRRLYTLNLFEKHL